MSKTAATKTKPAAAKAKATRPAKKKAAASHAADPATPEETVEAATHSEGRNILVLDIGGTHVKFRSTHHAAEAFVSGPKMTPERMMKALDEATAGWNYDHISIGFPGPVVHNLPLKEPANLGKGWMHFHFDKAFGNKPLRMINDAAMQALGSYHGGRMLFLGLGTGLGSAMVVDGVVQAMEIAHLPWKHNKTYEEYLGEAALKKQGKSRWNKHVHQVIHDLQTALECDYVVLGGGNAKLVKHLSDKIRLGANANAFKGGFLLWKKEHQHSR